MGKGSANSDATSLMHLFLNGFMRWQEQQRIFWLGVHKFLQFHHSWSYICFLSKCFYTVENKGVYCAQLRTQLWQKTETHCYVTVFVPFLMQQHSPGLSLSLCRLIHSHCSVHTYTHIPNTPVCFPMYLTHRHTYCTYTGTLPFPPLFLFYACTRSHAHCKQ